MGVLMEPERHKWRPLHLAAGAAALAACAFSVLLSILMVSSLFDARASSPLARPELDQWRAALQADPANVAARDALRSFDFAARKMYFGSLAALRAGAWLLLGAAAAALIGFKAVAFYRRRLPDPRSYPQYEDPSDAAGLARFTLAATGLALLAGAVALGLKARISSADYARGAGRQEAPLAAAPAGEALWPGFRGPAGSGACAFTNLPVTWDVKTGMNIRWKSAVPLPGRSSPVIWGNRVFLTGATKDKREVYCYDLAAGTLLWRASVDSGACRAVEVWDDTGFAAPTPVLDGTNVYAVFANGDVAAVDFCSEPRWTVNLGLPVNSYGFASSPVAYMDKIIIQFDNNPDKGGVSELVALDKASGRSLWKTTRPVADSWPTPLLIETPAGPQLVAAANERIIAYSPDTGAEIWSVACQGSDSSPSPLFAEGLVIVPVTHDKVYAIRPGGRGDVSQSAVAWKSDDNVSDVPSPAAAGGLVFLLQSDGTLACFGAADGKKAWDAGLEKYFYASPVIAGANMYLVSREGEVLVLRAGPRHEEVARASLGEPSDCTPAFAPGCIVMRGASNLFCIAEK